MKRTGSFAAGAAFGPTDLWDPSPVSFEERFSASPPYEPLQQHPTKAGQKWWLRGNEQVEGTTMTRTKSWSQVEDEEVGPKPLSLDVNRERSKPRSDPYLCWGQPFQQGVLVNDLKQKAWVAWSTPDDGSREDETNEQLALRSAKER